MNMLPSRRKDKDNNEQKMVKASVSAVSVYSGPIPPAAELAKYEEILPGAADRILTMAENQSQHRQKLESKMLDASIKSELTGQKLGFTIFGLIIVAGFILVLLGKDLVGLVALITAGASIVGLFIHSRKSANKELQEKKKS